MVPIGDGVDMTGPVDGATDDGGAVRIEMFAWVGDGDLVDGAPLTALGRECLVKPYVLVSDEQLEGAAGVTDAKHDVEVRVGQTGWWE